MEQKYINLGRSVEKQKQTKNKQVIGCELDLEDRKTCSV